MPIIAEEKCSEELFRDKCTLSADALTKKGAHNFVVCVDGSDQVQLPVIVLHLIHTPVLTAIRQILLSGPP